MKVGVARETADGERRVALTPDALGKLQAAGIEVLVEAARRVENARATELEGVTGIFSAEEHQATSSG